VRAVVRRRMLVVAFMVMIESGSDETAKSIGDDGVDL
jgi:hypothetical protein